MPLREEDLADLKLLMLKELEKTLKIVYEHQYRNILSRIVSNRKRFVRKRLPVDASEKICRYNSLASEVTAYLANLFEVFGESAVLNARKTFEEHGLKWGKKLRRKLQLQDSLQEAMKAVASLYIDIPGRDFVDISDSSLIWHLNDLGCSRHIGIYDSKAAWLKAFIATLVPEYVVSFARIDGEGDNTLTLIEFKLPTS